MNSRRFKSSMGSSPEPAVPAYSRLRMRRKRPQVLGVDLNRSESSPVLAEAHANPAQSHRQPGSAGARWSSTTAQITSSSFNRKSRAWTWLPTARACRSLADHWRIQIWLLRTWTCCSIYVRLASAAADLVEAGGQGDKSGYRESDRKP